MSGNTKDFKVKNGIKPTAYHEAVGTVVSGSEGYSLAGASYEGVSFSVSSQTTLPTAVALKTDGTKLYVIDYNSGVVHQYTLSTAYDISTAIYDSISYNPPEMTTITGLFFKGDGSKMYLLSYTSYTAYQYNLSTAWDISTSSYDGKSFDFTSEDTSQQGIFIRPDTGTKLYTVGGTTDKVYQYTMSTAWDVSSASYDNISFLHITEESSATDLFFSDDGTKMFIVGISGDDITEYTLSTAWDISTASATGNTIVSQALNPYGMCFADNGKKMYVCTDTNDTIYQYSTTQNTETLDLSSGSVFELTPTSDIQVTLSNPADSGTVSGATLLLGGSEILINYDLANVSYDSKSFALTGGVAHNKIQFSADGTKMFASNQAANEINEYSLSTAWDVSTASLSRYVTVSSYETYLRGFNFGDNGNKLYLVGGGDKDVHQFTLDTAYSTSSLNFTGQFSHKAETGTDAFAVDFNLDGTKMYILGYSNRTVFEYDLSTAWDVTSASYNGVSLSVSAAGTGTTEFRFVDNGSIAYVTNQGTYNIYYYTFSTPYDLSTATLSGTSFNPIQADNPQGIAFNTKGTKMYLVDPNDNAVYQYTVGSATPATITYDAAIQWASVTAPTSPTIGETDVLTFTTRDGGTTYNAALAIDGAQ